MEELQKPQTFLGWAYTDKCLVEGFSAHKYKEHGMNVLNPHYVYDDSGILMGVICGKTPRAARIECKKYILINKLNIRNFIHWINNTFAVHQIRNVNGLKNKVKTFFSHLFNGLR